VLKVFLIKDKDNKINRKLKKDKKKTGSVGTCLKRYSGRSTLRFVPGGLT
jgi:uridine kinase